MRAHQGDKPAPKYLLFWGSLPSGTPQGHSGQRGCPAQRMPFCPTTATAKPTSRSLRRELFLAVSSSPLPPPRCRRALGLTASHSLLTFPAKPRKAACVSAHRAPFSTRRPAAGRFPAAGDLARAGAEQRVLPGGNGIDLPLKGSRKAFLCRRPKRRIWSQRTIGPLSR